MGVNSTLTFSNTTRRDCLVVRLMSNSSMMLEMEETFFLVLSNPAPVSVSDVVFNSGSNATVVISDLNSMWRKGRKWGGGREKERITVCRERWGKEWRERGERRRGLKENRKQYVVKEGKDIG